MFQVLTCVCHILKSLFSIINQNAQIISNLFIHFFLTYFIMPMGGCRFGGDMKDMPTVVFVR